MTDSMKEKEKLKKVWKWDDCDECGIHFVCVKCGLKVTIPHDGIVPGPCPRCGYGEE